MCVHWRPEESNEIMWKTDGCSPKTSDGNCFICECEHLTAFAIMNISRELVSFFDCFKNKCISAMQPNTTNTWLWSEIVLRGLTTKSFFSFTFDNTKIYSFHTIRQVIPSKKKVGWMCSHHSYKHQTHPTLENGRLYEHDK